MLPDGWEKAADAALWELLKDADDPDRADVLFELGLRRSTALEHEASLALFAEAADVYDRLGNERSAAISVYNLGQSLWRVDRNVEAIDELRGAAERYAKLGLPSDEADCHYFTARALVDEGRAEEALAEYAAASRLKEIDGDLDRAARGAMDLGEALGRLGRPADALEQFTKARGWFRSLGQALDVVWADDRRAAALIETDRVSEAIGILQSCVLVQESSGTPEGMAYAQYRLGWTLRIDDQHEEALPVLAKARSAYQEIANARGAAWCDLESAHCLYGLERYSEALDLYVRCRATFDALGDDYRVDLVDASRADCMSQAGNRGAALVIQRELLERVLPINPWAAARVSGRMAFNLISRDVPQEALEVLARTDEVAETAFADDLFERNARRQVRALALKDVGDDAAALELCELVLSEIADSNLLQLRADTHQLHGRLIQADDPEGSDQEFAYAVALFLASGDVESATELSREFKRPATPRRSMGPQLEGPEGLGGPGSK